VSLASEVSDQLIGFLFNQSLYAIWTALFVWSVLAIVKPRHPAWSVALWTLVLVRLVVPVDMAMPWSARAGVEFVAQSVVPGALVRPAIFPVYFADFSLVALAIWSIGAVVGLIFVLQAHFRARAVVRHAILPVSLHLRDMVDAWRGRLKVRRAVRIIIGEDSISPFTMGIASPVIYLPNCLHREMNDAEISAIIGHEMAHVKGYDALWLLMEHIAKALFFFNPAVRLAVARISEAREALRDLQVLSAAQLRPQLYLGTLLRVMKLHQSAAHAPLLVVSLGKSAERLKQRLVSVKDNAAREQPSRRTIGLVMGAILLFVLPMAQNARHTVVPDQNQQAHMAVENAVQEKILFVATLPQLKPVRVSRQISALKHDMKMAQLKVSPDVSTVNETQFAFADRDLTPVLMNDARLVRVSAFVTEQIHEADDCPENILLHLKAQRARLIAALQLAHVDFAIITEVDQEFDVAILVVERLKNQRHSSPVETKTGSTEAGITS
jgi:beta-lactamase regulating signal transducer with metallopeptidase domain